MGEHRPRRSRPPDALYADLWRGDHAAFHLNQRCVHLSTIYHGGHGMATHQTLSGVSDEEFLQRLLATHPERFGADFWEMFAAQIAPHLPPRPVVIDLGCGPGLFLRDLGERYPQAALYGYDVTPAMIAYGRQLPSTGPQPTLVAHDVATQPLPHEAGTVH